MKEDAPYLTFHVFIYFINPLTHWPLQNLSEILDK